jgi:hypothetical protein
VCSACVLGHELANVCVLAHELAIQAEAGNATAQRYLGLCYTYGTGGKVRR